MAQVGEAVFGGAENRGLRRFVLAGTALTIAAGVLDATRAEDVVRFAVAGAALAALAAVVGEATESVGERVGAGATGLLQSTIGNLPELFVGIFALHAGLYSVVRAALVGSVLGNALLVLGCAFVAGGLRHGRGRFDPEEPRLYGSLLLLAVAALVVPTIARHVSTPAAAHTGVLSDVSAGVLLVVYACTIPWTLRRRSAQDGRTRDYRRGPRRGLGPALGLLVVAGLAAGAVSDWFVSALDPAIRTLGLSQTFTGLVVVAVAANAVEHAVGVRFALRNKPDFAVTTTLSSSLQVALLLTPLLVLVSNLVGPHPLSLVFPLSLVVALAVATLVVVSCVFDGEYTWIEGVALIGLYVMLAASFWWG